MLAESRISGVGEVVGGQLSVVVVREASLGVGGNLTSWCLRRTCLMPQAFAQLFDSVHDANCASLTLMRTLMRLMLYI